MELVDVNSGTGRPSIDGQSVLNKRFGRIVSILTMDGRSGIWVGLERVYTRVGLFLGNLGKVRVGVRSSLSLLRSRIVGTGDILFGSFGFRLFMVNGEDVESIVLLLFFFLNRRGLMSGDIVNTALVILERLGDIRIKWSEGRGGVVELVDG